MVNKMTCNRFVKRVTKKILATYKSQRFLWDHSHELYNSQVDRVKGYKKMLENYKEINPDATLIDLKLKLGHMRTGYKRELKKVILSRVNGDDPPYTPTLWYFDDLKFLDEDPEVPTSSGLEASYLETNSDDEDSNTSDNEAGTAVSNIKEKSKETDMPSSGDIVKSVMTEVIQAYKEQRHLWDTKHALHLKKRERIKALNKILAVYKKIDHEATIIDIKRKLKNLRAGYDRERKKVMDSRMNPLQPQYVPTLWYYHLLSFLHEDTDQVEEMEELYLDDNWNSDDESQMDASETKLETSEVSLNQSEGTILIDNRSGSVRSESRIFGASVGMQLEEMELTQRVIAEKLIWDVTFQGRMKMLTTDSCISTNDNK